MADTKYSMSEATLDSFGLPALSVTSEPFGLSGFTGAMAQLGMALNAASLNIRLLTAQQGELGKVLESLTAALFTPRPQLKAFSPAPRVSGESPFRLNIEVEPRPSIEPPRVPMALPASDKSAGHALQPSPGTALEKYLQWPSTPEHVVSTATPAEPQRSATPVSLNPMAASLERLHNVATPDLSAPLDRFNSFAEQTPVLGPGLAAVAVGVYALASKVVDEALANAAKKILKWGTPRLPFGLGTLIDEPDGAGHQGEKRRPPTAGKGSGPNRNDAQADHEGKARGRNKPGKKTPRNNLPPPKIEVQRRTPVPSNAQTRGLTGGARPARATSLFGRVASVGAAAGRLSPPLRLLNAGVRAARGIASGDRRAVVSSAGVLAGSYAGAAAGAALGTLVFPVIGTAIGGLVGSFAGSGLGTMLGEKLGGLVDRLSAPEQVSKDLTSAQAQNTPINFAPSIQVTCPNADSAEQIRSVVAQQLQAQFHGEFVPLMTHNALATRRDAALTDGGV